MWSNHLHYIKFHLWNIKCKVGRRLTLKIYFTLVSLRSPPFKVCQTMKLICYFFLVFFLLLFTMGYVVVWYRYQALDTINTERCEKHWGLNTIISGVRPIGYARYIFVSFRRCELHRHNCGNQLLRLIGVGSFSSSFFLHSALFFIQSFCWREKKCIFHSVRFHGIVIACSTTERELRID